MRLRVEGGRWVGACDMKASSLAMLLNYSVQYGAPETIARAIVTDGRASRLPPNDARRQ